MTRESDVSPSNQGLSAPSVLVKATLAEFFNTHAKRILAVALGKLGNPQDAEDVLQETVLEMWEHRENFRGESQLSTWAYRICVNKCIDRLRKKWPELTADGTLPEFEVEDGDLSDTLSQQQEIRRVRNAIRALRNDFRMVVEARLSGLSDQEIADQFNRQIGTVKSQLSRSRDQLRAILSL